MTPFEILDGPMPEYTITNWVSRDRWCIAHEAGERGAECRSLRRPPEYSVLTGPLPRPSRAARRAGEPPVWARGRCAVCHGDGEHVALI